MDETGLRAELRAWPGLFVAAASCGTGWAARTEFREVLHLHGSKTADLHLTHALIERLRPELAASAHLTLHPGAGWVTLHLDHPAALDLLRSLVSLGLAANSLVNITSLDWRTPCTRQEDAARTE